MAVGDYSSISLSLENYHYENSARKNLNKRSSHEKYATGRLPPGKLPLEKFQTKDYLKVIASRLIPPKMITP